MVRKKGSSLVNHKHPTKHKNHPVFRQRLTAGQKAADTVARLGGSWGFLGVFAIILIIWIVANAVLLSAKPFDPYPFILLNLCLSVVAAMQAPIILMTQNRQAERDRIDAHYDHAVNRKAEREIQQILKDIEVIKRTLREIRKK
ncbi:DUF1003 domain-containing protein [Candidatus Woesearchaeota archaeon]|jgi:uncharacterized membrane protein|nr:DUF1003 domain-containing protein [Candidatus Woesearchaeota archaeon]MBT5740072.1 DUF1003 domain-containing protein [Candidatus Woesearchaeota archaeon]